MGCSPQGAAMTTPAATKVQPVSDINYFRNMTNLIVEEIARFCQIVCASLHTIVGVIWAFRDWSLITGRGGYKIASPKLFATPPSRQGKTFGAPPPFLKRGNFLPPPPFYMAKTSSYRIKTTPKLVVPSPPPSAWLKFLLPPPPFFRRGKTSCAPPPVCSPPPPRN